MHQSLSRFLVRVLGPALLIFPVGCGNTSSGVVNNPPPVIAPALTLSPFVSGLAAPVGMEEPNDGSGRLFVLEQAGQIRIIQNGSLVVEPFLDLTSKVESGGEEGLLGLAFHRSFSSNGRFFVYYTQRVGAQLQSVFSEYAVSGSNPNQADAATERILLVVDQPFDNHNGGQLAFGPDGFLYIGLGDGGSGGDPLLNGQNLQVMLGKVLRIDVDGVFAPGKQYAIPEDNPFSQPEGLSEIWAYGLRNPWRFSFDRMTGSLLVGDVGQDSFEEVDILTKGGNFGWNTMEGSHCYPPGSSCDSTGLVPPIMEYAHDASGGESIIGGFVYRGAEIPALAGNYVFGDLTSGNIWAGNQDSSGHWSQTLVLKHTLTVSSFGQDAAGELYVLDYGNGAVLSLRSAS
jgi:glucose/arabinose dehydrogenase